MTHDHAPRARWADRATVLSVGLLVCATLAIGAWGTVDALRSDNRILEGSIGRALLSLVMAGSGVVAVAIQIRRPRSVVGAVAVLVCLFVWIIVLEIAAFGLRLF